MQKRYAFAFAAVLAIAIPNYAQASQNTGAVQSGGTVCGRVNAPSNYILRLYLAPTHDNVIYARSARDEVRSTVNTDGNYCFTGLKNDVYTITAFNDGSQRYAASVKPIDGRTITLDLSPQPSTEDIGPAAMQSTYAVKP